MGGSVHYDKGSKRWFVQIYWECKKPYRFWRHPVTNEPFYDRRSAEKQLNRIRTEIDEGYFNPVIWLPESPMSLEVYASEWLEATQDEVSPNTYKDYRLSIKNHIVPFFGEKDIRRIRYSDIVKFHAWIPRAPKGKYNVVSCLKTLMRYAWRNEDILKVPPFPKLSYELSEIGYLEFEQQNSIIKKIPAQHRPIFYFMQEYGVRPGEARALMRDCVKGGEIIIKRAFSENTLRETTKTGKGRRYEITPFMQEVFEFMPLKATKFVFTRKDGKPYEKRQLSQIFHAARKKLSIPHIKMYNAFRHSLGCQLLDQGEDIDLVRQQLGHTKIEMTQRYAKRSNVKLTDALNRRRENIILLKEADKD